MTVNCEAMVEKALNCQASESDQLVDASSAKTIEFLRARLLAERAASKSARQQAQDISEKVKDLHTCLEKEIELRKEAEAAMEKVFAVLKAKGVALDGITPAAPTDIQAQSEEGASPFDIVEDTNEAPSETADISTKTEISCPVLNRNGAIQKGAMGCETDFAENQQCVTDQVQDVIKEVVHPDHDIPDCTCVTRKDVGTGQSLQHGLSITSKLKAVLQQIEEEVGALPEEQPLRVKLQGWVGQAANMLDSGQEASLSGGLEILHSNDCTLSGCNCPSEAITTLETKDTIHTKVPGQSKYADAIHLGESGLQPAQLMHKIAGAERSASPVPPIAQLHQRHSTFHTPTIGKDSLLHSSMSHHRKPCCESPCRSTMAGYVSQDSLIRGPWPPQMSQYDNSHSKLACPPMIPCGLTSTCQNIGSESSYLLEVPSPKSSDVLWVGDKLGYGYGQQNEFWSPTRASALEGQNVRSFSPAGIGGQNAWSAARASALEGQSTWSPARIGGQHRAVSSNGCFIADASNNELLGKFERGYTHQKIHPESEEHSSPHSRHLHQARDVRKYSVRGMPLQPKDLFSSHDAALSVMDDRNGRLGGILMALDAARQHIQDDELMGPTPTRADPRLRRGYRYGDPVQQLASSEFQHDTWRPLARSSLAPIIQFPPSPTSDRGYSPFERPHSAAHRRSSSVSTNFMMSGWDNYMQQPRGEVELGNGITLYMD